MDWTHGHNSTIHNGISRIGFYTGGQQARFRDEDLADEWVTESVQFMVDNKDRPFFLYMAPTLIENVDPRDEISTKEVFGPIACLYRVQDFAEALALANDSPYGLTACIHTRSLHRAIQFTQKVQAGVAVVNAGTYGSEPHMPFGGLKQSGNGWREPGTEALDVYSELKDVYINIDPDEL